MACTYTRNPSRPRRKSRGFQKGTRSTLKIDPRHGYNQHYRDGDIRDDLRGHNGDGCVQQETQGVGETISGSGGESGGETNPCQKTEEPYGPEKEEALIYTVSPRPSLVEAIKCKCCECSANYDDGRLDCRIRKCPLYSRMPYRRSLPDFSWVFGKFSKTHTIKCEKSNITPEKYLELCLDFYLTKDLSPLIKRISLTQMIRAKCYDCCGNYVVGVGYKGRIECGLQNCSLYYWTPYREMNPSYNWMFDVPYTRRHRMAINAFRMPRNTYIQRVLVDGERL